MKVYENSEGEVIVTESDLKGDWKLVKKPKAETADISQ